MEYLINVALTFAPYATFGIVIWLVASMLMKQVKEYKNKKVYRGNAKYLLIYLAITLVFAATSPSITYKHQPFNAQQEAQQIEMLNQQEHNRADLKIEDRTRPDAGMTKEEWDAKSSYEKTGE